MINLIYPYIQRSYERAMSQLHGENWQEAPGDSDIEWLKVSGGKPHGKVYGIGSIVDTSKIQSSPSCGRTSSGANYATAESSAPVASQNPEQFENLATQLQNVQTMLLEMQREKDLARQREEDRQRIFEESQRNSSLMFRAMQSQMEFRFEQMYRQPWPFQMVKTKINFKFIIYFQI